MAEAGYLNGNGVVAEAAQKLNTNVDDLLEKLTAKLYPRENANNLAKVFQTHYREWKPLPEAIRDSCWDAAVHGKAIC